MNTNNYRKKVESELITEFLNKFYEKVGYYPTVTTDSDKENKQIKVLPLAELEKYFDAYLPNVYDKQQRLSSKSRIRPLVELRFKFYYIARQMGYTLVEIGYHLNGIDHTTILHGLKTFKNLYEVDEKFRQGYDTIINNIKKNNEPSALEHLNQMEIES